MVIATKVSGFDSRDRRLASAKGSTTPTTMAEKSFTVLYFAAARTETGIHKEVIPIPPGSTGVPLSELGDLLVSRHPDTKLREVLDISSWSVDEEMVDDDLVQRIVLRGGEEVGVICPVSGG
ncbi:hypothetical protein RSAG8_05676, partial [Rhizoctonia solani AG-8 WAC10335]